MDKLLEIMFAFGIFILIFIAISAIISLPVMLLWDWLMPTLFGLSTITWVQSWGLLILCGFLFKNTTTNKD